MRREAAWAHPSDKLEFDRRMNHNHNGESEHHPGWDKVVDRATNHNQDLWAEVLCKNNFHKFSYIDLLLGYTSQYFRGRYRDNREADILSHRTFDNHTYLAPKLSHPPTNTPLSKEQKTGLLKQTMV